MQSIIIFYCLPVVFSYFTFDFILPNEITLSISCNFIVFCFTGDPCLSFEILQDGLGQRENFPHTSYLVGGTQAEAGHFNYILLMKMYNMHKTQKKEKDKDNSDDSDDSSDEDEDMSDDENENKTPQLRQTYIKHNGCVNRITTHITANIN